MKVIQLKIKNLGPFHVKPVELDFKNGLLADASLVAITGRTGAGKTMLFDAICVALYGKTPRLSSPKFLLSQGETEGYAEVIFEVNRSRYLAEWRVTGTTPETATTSRKLFNADSEKCLARGRAVRAKVESILGLDFDAFTRSVMLAQGEFAAFLRATPAEKLAILEATAGLGIYDALKGALNDKMNEVRDEKNALQLRLDAIPEASREQVSAAEETFLGLEEKARTLAEEKAEAECEKKREEKRVEAFEKLQSSEKRQAELIAQAPDIAEREAELDRAIRANRLIPVQETYDNAISEQERAESALCNAETARDTAKSHRDQRLADFDEVDAAYQTAHAEQEKKSSVYDSARLDVQRAQDRFAQACELIPEQKRLDEQIGTLSNQLTDDLKRQTELERQIQEAETFLYENPLPLDRHQRFTRVNRLLVEYRARRSQWEGLLANQREHASKVSSLKDELAELSQNSERLVLEKTTAGIRLTNASEALDTLLKIGSLDEWQNRKAQAQQALPIARDYEIAQRQRGNEAFKLEELENSLAGCNESLAEIERQLAVQRQVCKRADAEVSRLEAERELAVLADPINELRQKLEPGEPCLVCGAIEHPGAGDVEIETANRLETLDNALGIAKTVAREALEKRDFLVQKQIRQQENKTHVTDQIKVCLSEIKRLNGETEAGQAQWQEIYPDTEISSDWASQQNQNAETAIAALREAEASHGRATHDYEIAKQQLANCEQNIADKQAQLANAEQDLQTVTNALEGLESDIAATKTRFWETMPDAFHGLTLEDAVSQFGKRIKVVEAREEERDTKQHQLERLNLAIQTTRRDFEIAKQDRKSVHVNIGRYQQEGEALLRAASEKTGGLTTETDIDAAIKKLDAAVQEKAAQREEADIALRKSDNSLAGANAGYENALSDLKKRATKLEEARATYLGKLRDAGFDSPGEHNRVLREDAWIKQVAAEIDAYTQERDALEVDIACLRARFAETPFDPEELGRITERLIGIEKEVQETQRTIGVQQGNLNRLKADLAEREALAEDFQKASDEFTRWDNLRYVFHNRLQIANPNDFPNFAAEITLQQVSQFANAQLEYLTSGRYQLKVESIGKLAVVDKWNANEERPVETLSGGESFLTSLALALALSELSRGRAEIGALFLDEGFGTLDAETLDIAISALERLSSRKQSISADTDRESEEEKQNLPRRSIFLISHIQELTRRLPVKINVRKRGNGSSTVRVQG